MRQTLGILYGVFSLILIGRAGLAAANSGGLSLLTENLIQTLAFLAPFLFLMGGGPGFVLLLKERSDRRLRETYGELAEQVHFEKIRTRDVRRLSDIAHDNP